MIYLLIIILLIIILVFLTREKFTVLDDDLEDYDLSDNQNISHLEDVEPLEQYGEFSRMVPDTITDYDASDIVESIVSGGAEIFPDKFEREQVFGDTYPVPLNNRGYTADDRLTRAQQWLYAKSKRAIDGATQVTKFDYAKNISDEIDDVANRRWWDREGFETNFTPRY